VSIARKAVRGAAWTIATGIGSRALGLVGTLALTRFVAPDIYGEVSAASVITLLFNQFSTWGVGQYVIAKPKAGREIAWHATVVHVGVGAVALLLAVLLRTPLGPFFNAPTMGQYVPLFALSVMLDRLSFMPERVLVRDMRFGPIGIARTAGEITYTGVSLGLAVLGWGGMAIVWGNVARSAIRVVMMVRAADSQDWLSPSPIRWETIKTLLGFGLPLSVGAFAGFASRRVDNLLVSRFFGPTVMGHYNLAYNLADIPAVQVGEQIGDVLLPSFAQLEEHKRADALLRSTTLLALIMFPLAIGLGAVSPTVVAAFFDYRWAPVAPMLMLLSALSVARPIGWTISSYLVARDRPRVVSILELFKVFALLGTIIVLGRRSPEWTCLAVGVAFGLHTLASLWVVQLSDGISLFKFLGRLLPPLLACVPMVAAILGVRHGRAYLGWHHAMVGLVAETTAGGVAYVLSALVLARTATREFLRLIKHAIGKRRGTTPADAG
jgi:lipopolysaccharide exporter